MWLTAAADAGEAVASGVANHPFEIADRVRLDDVARMWAQTRPASQQT